MTNWLGCEHKWWEDCPRCKPEKEAFHKAIVDSMKECDHGWNGTCFWCKSVKKTIKEEIEK